MTTNNKYQIWITFNGEKEKIRLPVLPEKINISSGTKDQSVDIVGLGEILIPQSRPATEYKFSSFFPAKKFPGVAFKTLTAPKILVEKIMEWKNSTKPVHLIVTGTGIDTYCRISKFSTDEAGGDVGTINYEIALKEYREPTIRKVNISSLTASVQKDTTRTDNTSPPRTYTVKAGDTLWSIAKKFLGRGDMYSIIVDLNKDIIKRPNLIYPGQVLRIK